jgi:hypothetical protein
MNKKEEDIDVLMNRFRAWLNLYDSILADLIKKSYYYDSKLFTLRGTLNESNNLLKEYKGFTTSQLKRLTKRISSLLSEIDDFETYSRLVKIDEIVSEK